MALTLEAIDYGGGSLGVVAVSLSNITSTAGRLLVLDVVGSSTSAAWTGIVSDGWTLADGAISGAMAAAQFYRIDSGSYTGFSVDVGSGNMLATIRQYSGNATSSVLDDSAFDDTNSGSASTTCYSGSATSTADGAAVSANFWRDNRFVDGSGGPTLGSGFTLEDYVQPASHGFSTGYPGINLGFKAYTGSASHSVTATTPDTGDENIGVIGLYKAVGGGTDGSTTLTGTSGTTSAGTLSATGGASSTLTGASTTSAAGTLTASAGADATASLSGAGTTATAGTVSASAGGSATATLTGASTSASVGVVSASGAAAVTLSGIGATASAGNVLASSGTNATATLTGASVSATVGALSATGAAQIVLTGASVTASAGTVTAVGVFDAVATLTGAGVTAYAGTLAAYSGFDVPPGWTLPGQPPAPDRPRYRVRAANQWLGAFVVPDPEDTPGYNPSLE